MAFKQQQKAIRRKNRLIARLRREQLEAYQQGWIAAATWANRDDLVLDIDSPAYLKERHERNVINP